MISTLNILFKIQELRILVTIVLWEINHDHIFVSLNTTQEEKYWAFLNHFQNKE